MRISGRAEIKPDIEMTKTKYETKRGVQAYFEEKRRLGLLAKLPEQNIVNSMIDGLPSKLSRAFIGRTVGKMSKFYLIAMEAEKEMRKQEAEEPKPSPSSRRFDRIDPFNSERESEKYKRKKEIQRKESLPGPCSICFKLGYPGRYHWLAECRNKGQEFKKQAQDKEKTLN